MKICKSKTGRHSCFSREARKSDFEKYGVGIVVYFQFLKYMAFMFFFISLLSVAPMIFFYFGTQSDFSSPYDLITGTSLGNLGQAQRVCSYEHFDFVSVSDTYESELSLSCPYGNLDSIEVMGQMFIETEP